MVEYRVPGAAGDDWADFVKLYAGLRRGEWGWSTQTERIVAWYETYLTRRYDDATVRMGDLVQLKRIASTYATRERFLTEVTLDPPDATSDKAGVPLRDEDYVILSTIHSAKGHEWQSVSVLNVIDGCLPSDMATGDAEQIEEERRLLYVAMTRAKDNLQLMVPQRFYVSQQAGFGDRHVYATRSRFVSNAIARQFEQTQWPAPELVEERRSGSRARVNLSEKMKAMWK